MLHLLKYFLPIKSLWTLIPRILTYGDFDPRPLVALAWIKTLIIILEIASNDWHKTHLNLVFKTSDVLETALYNCALRYRWSSKIPHTRVKGHRSRIVCKSSCNKSVQNHIFQHLKPFSTKLYQTWIIYSSSNMLMVQARMVPGIPNSIWMISSEESSIKQCQINIIEVFN